MPRDLRAVQVNRCGVESAEELQKDLLAAEFFRLKLPHVPALAAVVIISAVLAVHGVPGVRECDGLALCRVLHGCFDRHFVLQKAPVVIDQSDVSHDLAPLWDRRGAWPPRE